MKLFPKTLGLFLVLGVAPTLVIAVVFALPLHWSIAEYKIFVGILLIMSTVSTLCLAGLITRLLKKPLNKLIAFQKAIQDGSLTVRLPLEGGSEVQTLFQGFNKMAEGLARAVEQEKMLVEASTFSKLASQVIHDLRSPLASLEAVNRLIESKQQNISLPDDAITLLQLSTRRLRKLSEELLAAGREKRTPQLIPLKKTLEELLLEFKSRNQEGLHIRGSFSSEELFVAATATEIQRAVGNIITNAIEALQGAGEIHLKIFSKGDAAHIDIQDNGPGIPAQLLSKVLRGGFTHGKIHGNGIGMTVVREVLEKHGGKLDAVSTVGKGTTFTLTLPLISETTFE